MESSSVTSIPQERRLAGFFLAVLSLILLLTGVVVLAQIAGEPLPNAGLLENPIPLAVLDALLVIAGSAASLVYLVSRVRSAWNVAVVLNQIAVVTVSLLAMQGIAVLVSTPARGDFGGLVNVVILLFMVVIPVVVTLITLAALCCLIAIRPEPQSPLATWVKRMAKTLALALLVLGAMIFIGVRNTPAARFSAQKQHMRAGGASIDELAEALSSPKIDVRFWAVQELRTKGPQAKVAVPALANALHDNQMISWPAAEALEKIGPDAAPAIPALVDVIKKEQGKGKANETGGETPSTFSWLAGKALAGIGPASIPELLTLLAHEDRFVRMTAAQALGSIGSPADEAVPALNNLLNDDDEMVRRYAGVALDRIHSGRPKLPAESSAPGGKHEAANQVQEIPLGPWTTLTPYAGDPRNCPAGTVCLSFDDGYRWLISESVLSRETRVEGDRKIEAAITATRRYEHVLGTNDVRTIELAETKGANDDK